MTDFFERLRHALADRYRIERELGAGGVATVYLAVDVKHHRRVAVKVLRPVAGALVEAIMSDVCQPVPATVFTLSRLRSAKRETRVKWLLGVMTRYFFSAPFHHRRLPSEAGVAFDVTLCPLPNYFKDQGVPELTAHAACNLDYCAAREFGVDLVRSQTIADGAAHCDFRWKFTARGARPQKAGQS